MGERVDRQTMTVSEAAKALGIGRGSAYEAVRRGDIPSLRVGRRLVVPRAAFERLLADATPGATSRPPAA